MTEIENLRRLVREFLTAYDEKVHAELVLAQAEDACQACDDEDSHACMEDIKKASQALRKADHAYRKTRMNIEEATARKDGEA